MINKILFWFVIVVLSNNLLYGENGKTKSKVLNDAKIKYVCKYNLLFMIAYSDKDISMVQVFTRDNGESVPFRCKSSEFNNKQKEGL